jgi:hypothetical protein
VKAVVSTSLAYKWKCLKNCVNLDGRYVEKELGKPYGNHMKLSAHISHNQREWYRRMHLFINTNLFNKLETILDFLYKKPFTIASINQPKPPYGIADQNQY